MSSIPNASGKNPVPIALMLPIFKFNDKIKIAIRTWISAGE